MTEQNIHTDYFPLIIGDNFLNGSVTNPISGLVNYVNKLFKEGFSPDTLPQDYADLYYLDFHNGQVRNGGHSQFIHNCHDQRDIIVARAIRGAQTVNMPKLADILTRCQTWIAENPKEAAVQTGSDIRAEALSGLDAELYALEFDAAAFEEIVKEAPAEIAARLRYRLFVPQDAQTVQALVDRFVSDATENAKRTAPKAGIVAALPVLDPLFDWRRKTQGETACESKKELLSLGMNRFERGQEAEMAAELRDRVQRQVLKAGLYDRSLYHLQTYLWVASHPNLEVVPAEQWRARVAAFAATNADAVKEKARRETEVLHGRFRNEDKLTLQALLGSVLPSPDGDGSPQFVWSDPTNSDDRQMHQLNIHNTTYFLEKVGGYTQLRASKKNRWKAFVFPWVMRAARLRMMSQMTAMQYLNTKRDVVPGRKLAVLLSNQRLYELFRRLYMPEALAAFWPVEDARGLNDRAAYAERALILDHNAEAETLSWRLHPPEGPILFEAGPDGVEVTGAGRRMSLSREELAEMRYE